MYIVITLHDTLEQHMNHVTFGGADDRTCWRFTDDSTAWSVIGLVRTEYEWKTMAPGDEVSPGRGMKVVIVSIKSLTNHFIRTNH